MNIVYVINIISIIFAIIGIILVVAKYYSSGNGGSSNGNGRNKNYFYGGPPGRQRFLKKEEFPLDRGWESFKCSNDEPNCNLNGHRGNTASALLRNIEFDPNK